jgi:hypothetical protein
MAFTLDAVVHLIQVALTPVFLLSGIAALLNVYAARLAKVSDRLDALTASAHGTVPLADEVCQEIGHLHRRALVLDVSVVLATVGAGATCMSILTLFLLALSNEAIAGVLLACFTVAIVCTLGSVATFGLEMFIGNRALRLRMAFHVPLLAAKRPKPRQGVTAARRTPR